MKYKIGLSTCNLDIVEAFSSLRNRKSQFIEQALIHFMQTERGKNTLRLLVEHSRKVTSEVAKGKGTRSDSRGQDHAGNGGGRINVDSFLK